MQSLFQGCFLCWFVFNKFNKSANSTYTVCLKKNIPDIFSYNSRKHCRIFIIFGTLITEKVGNQ